MSIQLRMEIGKLDEAVPVGKASRVFFVVLELWYVSSWEGSAQGNGYVVKWEIRESRVAKGCVFSLF